MNSKTYKKSSMFNKYVFAIIAIVIMIAEIIGLVLLHNRDTSNDNNIDTNVNEQKGNQSEDIVTESKEYYDFIDTEYGTFDFTEEEFVSRYFKNIGNGGSYIEQGFERMKATIPNQYNYAAIRIDGINNLSIVTNPSNGKVESIKVSIMSYNGGQISDEGLASLIANVIAGIMNVTSDDSNNTEVRNKVQQIFNEMTDGSSIEKGVQLTYKYDPIGQNGGDNSIELKVVISDNTNKNTDIEKQNNNDNVKEVGNENSNFNNVESKTEYNNNEEVSTTTPPSNNSSTHTSTDYNNTNSSDNAPSNNTEQIETKYTTVPNLVGLDYDTATNKMTEAKIGTFGLEKEYIYTSNSSKDNTIAEQSLKAGTKVEEWEDMRKLKIYKYSEYFILEMPIKVVKKNVANKEELLSGQHIGVKYNDENVCGEYIDNSHFSGNDLIYKYPTPWINVSQPINSIKVDIYIGGDLVKTQNVPIKNLEGQKLRISGPNVRIDLDEITINITD